MIPSTPRSRRRSISARSSIVQTWRASPERCAARIIRGSTIGTPLCRTGSWRQSAPCRRDPAGQRGDPGPGDLPRPHRGADPVAGEGAEAAQPVVGEGADADPVEHVHPPQQGGERLDDGVGLAVEVEPGVRPLLDELGEQGDAHPGAAVGEGAAAVAAEPVAGVGHGDLGGGHLADPSPPVGDPLEDAVVEGDDGAVAGDVAVGLEVGGSPSRPPPGTPPSCSRGGRRRRRGGRRGWGRSSRGSGCASRSTIADLGASAACRS